jgi:hypothetical protein
MKLREQFDRAGITITIFQQTRDFYLGSTRGANGGDFYEFGNVLTLPAGVIYKVAWCGSYADCKQMFEKQSEVQQFIAKAILKKSEKE